MKKLFLIIPLITISISIDASANTNKSDANTSDDVCGSSLLSSDPLASSYEGAPIVIDGEIWPSVVHYVEAQKFIDIMHPQYQYGGSQEAYIRHIRFARDKHIITHIRMAKSPEEALKIGKDRSHPLRPNWDRPDWESVKDEVMFKALVAKFTQHTHLHDLLMSTGDAHIAEYTERDRYWGDGEDGEDGRGESKLGKLLMRLRGQLKQGLMPRYQVSRLDEEKGLMPRYELVSMAETRKHLLVRIENMGKYFRYVEEEAKEAYNLSKQIDASNISDIEKIDRMQMILSAADFFKGKSLTSSDEFIALINRKYQQESANFRYLLVKIGVSFALTRVVITDLRPLNISHNQKIKIYKIMARKAPVSFVEALPDRFGLNHSEIRALYLYALQFESSIVKVIEKLPGEIVDHDFIQEVINELHKSRFLNHVSMKEDYRRRNRRLIIQQLIAAAAVHGLNYRAFYIVDNKPFTESITESSEQERYDQPEVYPMIDQDPIRLVLQ